MHQTVTDKYHLKYKKIDNAIKRTNYTNKNILINLLYHTKNYGWVNKIT